MVPRLNLAAALTGTSPRRARRQAAAPYRALHARRHIDNNIIYEPATMPATMALSLSGSDRGIWTTWATVGMHELADYLRHLPPQKTRTARAVL